VAARIECAPPGHTRFYMTKKWPETRPQVASTASSWDHRPRRILSNVAKLLGGRLALDHLTPENAVRSIGPSTICWLFLAVLFERIADLPMWARKSDCLPADDAESARTG